MLKVLQHPRPARWRSAQALHSDCLCARARAEIVVSEPGSLNCPSTSVTEASGTVSSVICLFGGNVAGMESPFDIEYQTTTQSDQ
jgi:hypothetical protein